MATNFSDIYSGEQFNKAPYDERIAVRKDFFNKVILPQVRANKDNEEAVWKDFSSKYPIKQQTSNKMYAVENFTDKALKTAYEEIPGVFGRAREQYQAVGQKYPVAKFATDILGGLAGGAEEVSKLAIPENLNNLREMVSTGYMSGAMGALSKVPQKASKLYKEAGEQIPKYVESAYKSILDIPEKIATMGSDDLVKYGNRVKPTDDFDKIAPAVSRLSDRLGQDDTAKIIQDNMERFEKTNEADLVKELSNAVWRKEKFGNYGSISKVVNNQKVIDGTKTMPVYEAEMNLLKSQPIIKEQQKLLEPSNRYFDKVPQLKELLYKPAQKADHLSKVEYAETLSNLNKFNLSKKESERIMTYAVSQQKGGNEILQNMKKTVPDLTEKEIQAYDFMRNKYEDLYTRLNDARKLSGKKPFNKVDNYFTFFKQLENATDRGFNPVHANNDIINEFVNPNMTPFAFAKERIKNKLPVELDAKNVFKKYLHSSLENINFSPVITKANKLTNNLYDDAGNIFKLSDTNPHLANFIKNWSADLAGKKEITKIGGVQLKTLDKFAKRANQNLVYSVLSWNARSALMQPLAARNTLVEIGLPNTLKGFEMNLSPVWRKFAMDKSNVLKGRIFESGVEEAMTKAKGIARALGDIGIKPLQYLDMETAKGTWLGAYNKAIKSKMAQQAAIDYADDVIVRTQGSASRLDKTPITRTPVGKALALFQTFATADYQLLKKDILGIGKSMPKKEVFKKFMRYMAATEMFNIALEQAGIDTPFPNPYKTIQESAENGDSTGITALKVIEDFATVHPMLGSLKYGRTFGGSALNTLQKAYDDLKTKKEVDLSKFLVDVVKVTGLPVIGAVPGLGMAERFKRIKDLGGSNWQALTGKYPDRKKGIKFNKLK